MASRSGKPVSPARGGVFSRPVDERVAEFTQSVSYDRALYRYDILGSLAHARMLRAAKLLSAREEAAIRRGLLAIERDIAAGRFVFRTEYEDIHMNIEKALQAKIGAAAGKLHTARSRNDQIALDERLWIRDECGQALRLVRGVQAALAELAGKYAGDPMPGFTHLQPAQPVTCGHYLLAYVEMFERDRERFADARRRANRLPLGAAALAGTTLPIDRRRVARLLGFDGVMANSMDAVSDRDFLLDFAYAMSVCAVHVSRLAEDFILFAGPGFGWLQLDEAFATGSSIMPQKVNPDVLELLRGKTGRAAACLLHLLMLLKGLPLTYNRDLQEDKELLFDTTRQFKRGLDILAALLTRVRFRRRRMAAACAAGWLDATALAEYLVRQGAPFREAHHAVGALVRTALAEGVALAQLKDGQLRAAHRKLGAEARKVLGAERVLRQYASEGSANPRKVRRQVAAWRARLRR